MDRTALTFTRFPFPGDQAELIETGLVGGVVESPWMMPDNL